MSIPKVIHYCWFGGRPKGKLVSRCIESWKKHAPDYRIMEWNEQNYDVKKYPYAREAYEAEKYAFVSDAARFDILFSEGGIYLDTDVELLMPLDEFLEDPFFMGYSCDGLLSSGLIAGAERGSLYIKKILRFYEETHFLLPNGRPNTTTVCTIVTDILKQYGIRPDGKLLKSNEICLYPSCYFDPYDYERHVLNITDKTHSIHHYASSWKSKKDIRIMKIGFALKRLIGKDSYDRLARLKHRIMG